MNNNYYIEDFTEENYRKILKIGRLSRQYYGFDTCKEFQSGIILRHDIDFSVHRALRLAEIEKEENVFATYFIYLHSELYNFFEKEIIDKVRLIISLGGRIGLHFDPNFYDLSKGYEYLEKKAIWEQKLLEDILEIKIQTISFHNPDVVGWDKLEKEYIGNMYNVYCPYMKQEFEYCSDSNGYWRYKRLENVIGSTNNKLQILIHPVWWTKEIMYPRQRIETAVRGRAESTMRKYDNILRILKRGNIDG